MFPMGQSFEVHPAPQPNSIKHICIFNRSLSLQQHSKSQSQSKMKVKVKPSHKQNVYLAFVADMWIEKENLQIPKL